MIINYCYYYYLQKLIFQNANYNLFGLTNNFRMNFFVNFTNFHNFKEKFIIILIQKYFR